MKQFVHKIQDELGLHVRPAAMITKEVKKYRSKVTIAQKNKTADASSMISMVALSAKNGSEIEVNIEGDDEEEAYKMFRVFCHEKV